MKENAQFPAVYIVDGYRTPFLKAKSSQDQFSAADLAIDAARGLLLRLEMSPTLIDEVILGCTMSSGNEANIARIVALRLGCKVTTPAWTVQRNCASSLQSIDNAFNDIRLGRSNIVLCGGTEAEALVRGQEDDRAHRVRHVLDQDHFPEILQQADAEGAFGIPDAAPLGDLPAEPGGDRIVEPELAHVEAGRLLLEERDDRDGQGDGPDGLEAEQGEGGLEIGHRLRQGEGGAVRHPQDLRRHPRILDHDRGQLRDRRLLLARQAHHLGGDLRQGRDGVDAFDDIRQGM